MIISRLKANKMHFKAHFLNIVLHCIDFYDVNATISLLDMPVRAAFTKGFSMKTSLQITIIISKITPQTSTNDHRNSKTIYLINN